MVEDTGIQTRPRVKDGPGRPLGRLGRDQALVHGLEELLNVEGLRERMVYAQARERAHVRGREPAADHEYPSLEVALAGARHDVDAAHPGQVDVDDEQESG